MILIFHVTKSKSGGSQLFKIKSHATLYRYRPDIIHCRGSVIGVIISHQPQF